MSRKWRLMIFLAVITATGCGIRPIESATAVGTPQFFSQEVPTITQAPLLIITPTPVVVGPAGATATPDAIVVVDPPQDGGLVADIIEGFILPIWNFFLQLTVGTIQTLWIATGRSGGIGAQAACCGLPAILLMLWTVRWYNVRRNRRNR